MNDSDIFEDKLFQNGIKHLFTESYRFYLFCLSFLSGIFTSRIFEDEDKMRQNREMASRYIESFFDLQASREHGRLHAHNGRYVQREFDGQQFTIFQSALNKEVLKYIAELLWFPLECAFGSFFDNVESRTQWYSKVGNEEFREFFKNFFPILLNDQGELIRGQFKDRARDDAEDSFEFLIATAAWTFYHDRDNLNSSFKRVFLGLFPTIWSTEFEAKVGWARPGPHNEPLLRFTEREFLMLFVQSCKISEANDILETGRQKLWMDATGQESIYRDATQAFHINSISFAAFVPTKLQATCFLQFIRSIEQRTDDAFTKRDTNNIFACLRDVCERSLRIRSNPTIKENGLQGRQIGMIYYEDLNEYVLFSQNALFQGSFLEFPYQLCFRGNHWISWHNLQRDTADFLQVTEGTDKIRIQKRRLRYFLLWLKHRRENAVNFATKTHGIPCNSRDFGLPGDKPGYFVSQETIQGMKDDPLLRYLSKRHFQHSFSRGEMQHLQQQARDQENLTLLEEVTHLKEVEIAQLRAELQALQTELVPRVDTVDMLQADDAYNDRELLAAEARERDAQRIRNPQGRAQPKIQFVPKAFPKAVLTPKAAPKRLPALRPPQPAEVIAILESDSDPSANEQDDDWGREYTHFY